MRMENLKILQHFCYLGDMIGAGGGTEEAVRCRIRTVVPFPIFHPHPYLSPCDPQLEDPEFQKNKFYIESLGLVLALPLYHCTFYVSFCTLFALNGITTYSFFADTTRPFYRTYT